MYKTNEMPMGHMTRVSRGKGSTRTIAKRALRLAKKNVSELKRHTASASSAALTTSVAVMSSTYLNVPSGDDKNTRDGDVVDLTSLHLKASFVSEVSELSDVMNYVRVALVKYTSSDDIPAIPSPFLVNTMNAHQDGDVNDSKVIFDRVYPIGAIGGANNSTIGPLGFTINKFIPWRKRMHFKDSATASPLNCQLVLYAWAQAAMATSTFRSQLQIRFRDA